MMTPEEKKEIYDRLTSIENKSMRILHFIESDPATNQKGLVEQVADNKKDIENLKYKATWFGTVGGLIAGFVYWLIKSLITKDL